MKSVPRWQTLILALALVGLCTACVFACPTCKEGVDANDPHHQSLAAGFYYSILFMMSMPYIILGSFGYLAFLSIRRAKIQQEGADRQAAEPTEQ